MFAFENKNSKCSSLVIRLVGETRTSDYAEFCRFRQNTWQWFNLDSGKAKMILTQTFSVLKTLQSHRIGRITRHEETKYIFLVYFELDTKFNTIGEVFKGLGRKSKICGS